MGVVEDKKTLIDQLREQTKDIEPDFDAKKEFMGTFGSKVSKKKKKGNKRKT